MRQSAATSQDGERLAIVISLGLPLMGREHIPRNRCNAAERLGVTEDWKLPKGSFHVVAGFPKSQHQYPVPSPAIALAQPASVHAERIIMRLP